MAAEQLIEARQQYYILATEPSVAEHTYVIKRGDTFAVFNDLGDIDAWARTEEGLYHVAGAPVGDAPRRLSRPGIRHRKLLA